MGEHARGCTVSGHAKCGGAGPLCVPRPWDQVHRPTTTRQVVLPVPAATPVYSASCPTPPAFKTAQHLALADCVWLLVLRWVLALAHSDRRPPSAHSRACTQAPGQHHGLCRPRALPSSAKYARTQRPRVRSATIAFAPTHRSVELQAARKDLVRTGLSHSNGAVTPNMASNFQRWVPYRVHLHRPLPYHIMSYIDMDVLRMFSSGVLETRASAQGHALCILLRVVKHDGAGVVKPTVSRHLSSSGCRWCLRAGM